MVAYYNGKKPIVCAKVAIFLSHHQAVTEGMPGTCLINKYLPSVSLVDSSSILGSRYVI